MTQNMAYRRSLMKSMHKYRVTKAGRKYNKAWSYSCCGQTRWDGSAALLVCRSCRPHSPLDRPTEAERALTRDTRRGESRTGKGELWHRLREQGDTSPPGEPLPGHA